LLEALSADDLMIITADHGNDPTFQGTDHTRERVPLLLVGDGGPRDLGVREGFSDVGASVAAWLGVDRAGLPGRSFV
jgi:phosphopentomutase